MTLNNSSESVRESSEQSTPKNQKNIMELASDAVYKKVQSHQYDEATLLTEINKKDPSEILRATRETMRVLCTESPSDYSSLTEEDIKNKVSNASIIEMYRKILCNLKKSQEQLKNRVIGQYASDTFITTTRSGQENITLLDEWVDGQNEYDIIHMLKSRARLEKALKLAFGHKLETFTTKEESIENYLEILGVTPNDLPVKVQNSWYNLTTKDKYATPKDAVVFMDFVRDAPCSMHEKRKIITDLLSLHFPDGMNMKEAVRLGFIDTKEALRITKKQLAKWLQDSAYFDISDPEIKRERETWAGRILTDTTMSTYALSEILSNDAHLDKFLEKDIHGRPNILEEALAKGVEDNKSEYESHKFNDDAFAGELDTADWHGSFRKSVKKIQTKEGGEKIKNIDALIPGSVLHFTVDDGNGKSDEVYFQIEEVDVEMNELYKIVDKDGEKTPLKHRGMRMLNMTREGGIGPKGSWKPREETYTKLIGWMRGNDVSSGEVLSGEEFAERKNSSESDKIPTVYDEDEDVIDSIEKLEGAIGFRPQKDMMLSFEYEKGRPERVRITRIDEVNGTITLTDDIESQQISFAQFTTFCRKYSLRKGTTLGNVDDFSNIIKEMSGFSDVVIDGGVLYQVTKDKGAEKRIPITHLSNNAGEVMEIESIGNDGFSFKYGKIEKSEDTKGNPKIKKMKGDSQKAGFVQFLKFIDSSGEGFTPYFATDKKELDVEPSTHLHGYWLTKFLSGTSINDMTKGFEIFTHAIEHKLEKNSKFNSAKFADRYLSRFMPESFRGQLKSEMYSVQNEAMESILKMLEDTMSGKEARIYVRKKILLNKDARFEEVLAGMLYLAKKTGQLYSEENSDLANSKLWFHQLARTSGYTTAQSRNDLWKKAAAKSPKGEFAVETDVIERVLKLFEGQQMRIPPNIAPKFAGYIAEGISGQEEKGEKEVNMLSNIDQMNDYAMSKLNVGEGYKAAKCLDRIYGKNGDPIKLNTIPFTLVMSNMPELLGTDFGKKLHSQAVGEQIRTSHALAFGNDVNKVKMYRAMVWEAAEELKRRGSPDVLSDLRTLEDERSHVGEESHIEGKTEDGQKQFINNIALFWKKHGGALHPILQMTDPYIKTHLDNKVCKDYASRIGMITGMQRRRDNILKTDQMGEGNWKYDHTPPMDFKNLVYASVRSISSHDKSMSNDMYEQGFVPGVLGAMNKLRVMSTSDFPEWNGLPETEKQTRLEKKQKEIFTEYYITLIYYLRSSINKEYYDRSAKDRNYIRDLADQGIQLKSEDFRIPRHTKPADIHDGDDEKAERNAQELDNYDASRIEESFRAFLSAEPDRRRGVYATMRDSREGVVKGLDNKIHGRRLDYDNEGA